MSLTVDLAPATVNVNLNGAEILAQLTPQIQEMVKKEAANAIRSSSLDRFGKIVPGES